METLYANCSEIVMRLTGFNTDDPLVVMFVEKLMDQFKPYSDDLDCGEYAFFDDYDETFQTRVRDENFYDNSEDWVIKGCKSLGIKKEIFDNDRIGEGLFSVGNHFYYNWEGKVRVVDLGFSNIKKVDKINKELLKKYEKKKVIKYRKEDYD